MHHEPRHDVRLLVLLNPGRTSRHYMLGLAKAAERLGVLAGTIELGQIWAQVNGAGPNGPGARAEMAKLLRAQLASRRVTHVLGYVHNGVFDFGLERSDGGAPCSAFSSCGVRHILLWTDHPNWAVGGSALDSQVSAVLASPMHAHIVKSAAAAEELQCVTGWPNVIGMPMAEDYESLRPDPAPKPVYDAVMILSDAAPVPHVLEPFLTKDDPDPMALARAMRPAAMRAWGALVAGEAEPSERRDVLLALGGDWLDAKIARPKDSFHRLSASLDARHGPALAWMQDDAQRWYAGVAALSAVTAWRRTFWPAWLGRRVKLGVYGSPAERFGLQSPLGAESWVEYEKQASIYGLGACAININAAHDEEGLTHKPFQIAASGVACIHHAARGLGDCFREGAEVLTFERGLELLEHARRMAGDQRWRKELAEAMRDRAMRDHTWEARLSAMLRADAEAALGARAAGVPIESAA